LSRETEPEAAISGIIINQYRTRAAILFQPMEWIRTAVELAPYQYFVEWICWASTFGLMVRIILAPCTVRFGLNRYSDSRFYSVLFCYYS
jgi:hypothetical protein